MSDTLRAFHDDDAALRAVVEGVEAEIGEGFLRSIVRHVAKALGVRYVFVSELAEDGTTFRTLAFWGPEGYRDNHTFPLRGSPCESVLGGELAHHAERLQERFPDDHDLVDMRAESYCGAPIVTSDGRIFGHIAIFDDAPMRNGPRGLSILRIFAARAGAEIERQRASRALLESEAAFRDLYEEAPVAYAIVGIDGRIRHANRALAEMFGVPAPLVVGRSTLEFSPETPEGAPRVRDMIDRLQRGLDTRDVELECRRGDGTPIWASVSFRVLRDAKGAIDAARTALVDVTDRKHAEIALRESETRLDRILSSTMDAIVTIHANGRIVLFNDAAERVFRAPRSSALGFPLDPFLTDGFRTALAEAREAGGTTWLGTLEARRADGSTFAAEGTLSPVHTDKERLFTLVVRDVEERRQLEVERHVLSQQKEYLEEELKSVYNFEEIIGGSPRLRDALRQVGLVAGTTSSVLILGESGTGKELIARAVHSNSPRRDRPLVKVNCAAMPPGLIESELFGHEKGSFTGATERRIGRFELADGGTIFLDEIGETPPEVQVKLLRVLQEGELERVGSTRTIRVDTRVIAATNRDLRRAVETGAFRADLYYRLNVFPVHLPPLRARTEDVPPLAHYFLARYAAKIGRRVRTIPDEAMARLCAYPWPGNVRELENVIERAVILSAGTELEISAEMLQAPPGAFFRPVPAPCEIPVRPPAGTSPSLVDVERAHIREVLAATGGRIEGPTGAAERLGIRPSTLRSRMKRLGIARGAPTVLSGNDS